MKVIPIERANLRRLPDVVRTVADRLRAGQTVVAFPEGTTWCGLGYGTFRPAMFQGAVDAGRPVQPLRLTYHHRDGQPSTVARLHRRRLAAGVDPPGHHRPPHRVPRAGRSRCSCRETIGATWRPAARRRCAATTLPGGRDRATGDALVA